jgi:hypothetical protein
MHLFDGFLDVSQMEHKQEILSANSIIMIAVNRNGVPEDKRSFTKEIATSDYSDSFFVKVEILEPLFLLIRGSKKSNLLPAKCNILCLDIEAASLNNAYTIVSEQFEPHRRSHTGNIFTKGYYEGENVWFPLENLRNIEEAKFEEQLFLDYREFKLKQNYDEMSGFDKDEVSLISLLKDRVKITGKQIMDMFSDKEKYLKVIWNLTDKDVIEEIIR